MNGSRPLKALVGTLVWGSSRTPARALRPLDKRFVRKKAILAREITETFSLVEAFTLYSGNKSPLKLSGLP
jgi:hypothetical protein